MSATTRGPVHIGIRKGIPVAGGMAGGSADAAATLIALDHLWELGMDREALEDLAGALGSDVPFLVTGGTAVGSGRGELLAPVLARGTYHWVLALSEGGLSTPEVYAECDRLREGEPVPDPVANPALMSALRPETLTSWLLSWPTTSRTRRSRSCPTSAACCPRGWSTAPWRESSPGRARPSPSSWRTTRPALDLAVALTASGVARDVRRASGPVHGAHVIHHRID